MKNFSETIRNNIFNCGKVINSELDYYLERNFFTDINLNMYDIEFFLNKEITD